MRNTATTRIALAVLLMTLATTAAATQQDLLTKEEVEGVLGVSVEVEERGNNGNSFTSSSPLGSVTINIAPSTGSRMLKGSNETVPDLGDDAYFQLDMGNTVVLHVITGDSAIILSVTYPTQKPAGITDLKKVARDLAALALEEG